VAPNANALKTSLGAKEGGRPGWGGVVGPRVPPSGPYPSSEPAGACSEAKHFVSGRARVHLTASDRRSTLAAGVTCTRQASFAPSLICSQYK
jgi:hypothetical protein